MAMKVQALYTFSGEPGTTEMSIEAGEVLTVLNTDIGEGWWEGKNEKGQSGLFPASYVQKIEDIPVTAAPRYDQADDEWANPRYSAGDQNYKKGDDDWDDDWDDDTYSEIGPGQTAQNKYASSNPPLPGLPVADFNNFDDASTNYGSQVGTVQRKTLFSPSTKVTGDSYIMGTLHADLPDPLKTHIIQSGDQFIWSPITSPFTVSVTSPKKSSKFKGIKSFICYQLTPSFNNIQVSRRYKHFDWLHERLVQKFELIPIPPLPDKQISGRYDEQLIERRQFQLQEFIDWVCKHPVISKSEVLQHFLTCTEEKKWKAGKRQAEKDEYQGLNFCVTLVPPEKALLQSHVDQILDQCSTFVTSMDSTMKFLYNMCVAQAKRYQGPYKTDSQKIGEAFYNLGNALSLDEGSIISTSKLTSAIKKTGGAYIDIGKMFDEQSKHDWEPLGDKFHLYKGIVGEYPGILASHKGAMQKKRECERLTAEHKMEVVQLNEVLRRADVVSYAVLAEINHFKATRTADLKDTMKKFLREQINFYKRIIDKLENTYQQYDEE